MERLEHLSKQERKKIKQIIGEAFVTNELFHEFGTVENRKELVMRYLSICVDCAYRSKALYATDDRKAYIGLAYSDREPVIPKLQMLARLVLAIPFPILKKFYIISGKFQIPMRSIRNNLTWIFSWYAFHLKRKARGM